MHAEPTKSPAKSEEKAPAVGATGTPDFDGEKLMKDVKQKVVPFTIYSICISSDAHPMHPVPLSSSGPEYDIS